MSLADEVRSLRKRVADRLAELEPLMREYEQLRQLAAELGLDEPTAALAGADAVQRSGPPEPAGAPKPAEDARVDEENVAQTPTASARAPAPASASGRRRAARPRGGGGRGVPAEVVLVLTAVREHPGATVAELASMIGVPTTALYRPVRELTNEGALVKRGRGLFPADPA